MKILNLFDDIEDPRADRAKKHPLQNIIFIAFIGILAGRDSWIGMVDFAEDKQEIFAKYIDLYHGIPSPNTIRRIISLILPEIFQAKFIEFMNINKDEIRRIINIDGKVICCASKIKSENINIVSAWSAKERLFLGQSSVDIKENEILEIPKLMDNMDICGDVITIDAIGCQRKICDKIIEKNGDYVICLKENQKKLYNEVKDFFSDPDREISHFIETFDKGHGRIEHRICEVLNLHNINFLDNHNWPGLQSIAKITLTRQTKNKTTTNTRYYISSLNTDANDIIDIARTHWSIENQLHWVLDVTMNEDKSTIHNDHGPENISFMKKVCLNIFTEFQDKKMSISRLQNKIASSDKFLVEILEKIKN